MKIIKAIGWIFFALIFLVGLRVIFAENFKIALIGIGGGIAYVIWLAKKSDFL